MTGSAASVLLHPVMESWPEPSLSPVSAGELSRPIANAGRDIVVQPGEVVLLNGIESEALGGAKIIHYSWSLESGDRGVVMQVGAHLGGSNLLHSEPDSTLIWW